jgi:predicted heme/steroid binding protein
MSSYFRGKERSLKQSRASNNAIDDRFQFNEFVKHVLFTLSIIALFVLCYIKRALLRRKSTTTYDNNTNNNKIDRERKYTRQEIKKHNTKDDLWIIIDDKVYDLSEYAEEHPGGILAITKNAGMDATKGFRGPQHPSRVFDIVEEYMIGYVEF